MTAQDQERIEGQTSATNTATLMQNAGTKFAGRIVSDDKTARTVKMPPVKRHGPEWAACSATMV